MYAATFTVSGTRGVGGITSLYLSDAEYKPKEKFYVFSAFFVDICSTAIALSASPDEARKINEAYENKTLTIDIIFRLKNIREFWMETYTAYVVTPDILKVNWRAK